MRLTRLRIGRFRNAAPTELRFGPGHNVLIGRNGTGKTNLLKLIAAVVRGDLSPYAGEALELDWTLTDGTGTVTVHAVQDVSERELPGPLAHEPDVERMDWSYEIRVDLGADGVWDARVGANGAVITPPHDTDDGGPEPITTGANRDYRAYPLLVLFDIRSALSATDRHERIAWSTWSFLESTWALRSASRLDEGLDAFRWLTGGDHPEFGPCPPPPAVSWRRAGKTSHYSTTISGPLFREIRAKLDADDDPGSLRLDRTSLGFAATFCALTGFADLHVLPIPVEYQEGVQARFERLKFEARLPSGRVLSQELLSYGQRRLLAFLYQRDACPDVLLADELVNGFHHGWLEKAMDLLEGRQTFLTSQNPLLLDHLWFESAEDVRRAFVLCRSGAAPDAPPWRWSQLSEDEADRFKAAYDVGIQHVSELLQAQGLW
jgi:hypothetical protein